MNRVIFSLFLVVFSSLFLAACSEDRCEECNKKITKSDSEKQEVMEEIGIEGNLCAECYEKKFFEAVATFSRPAN